MPRQKPNKTVVGVSMDADVMEYLDVLGEREDRSRSWLINAIIREHAQRHHAAQDKGATKGAPRGKP